MADVTRGTRRKGKPATRAAWDAFAGKGGRCPYCGHEGGAHVLAHRTEHFFRPATEEERRKASRGVGRCVYHDSRAPGKSLVKVGIGGAVAAVVYCDQCAKELGTHQAVCYIAPKGGDGEIVGVPGLEAAAS